MDNHTDDRDAGLPPVGSPEELEEALKWLEDLTARQGATADLPNPIPSTTLDSPFNGLIDSEAVSYTHLDVYKRQLPKSMKISVPPNRPSPSVNMPVIVPVR